MWNTTESIQQAAVGLAKAKGKFGPQASETQVYYYSETGLLKNSMVMVRNYDWCCITPCRYKEKIQR